MDRSNEWHRHGQLGALSSAGHAAIRDQLESQLIFSYAFPTRVREQVLQRLVEIAPPGLDKAILFSSGTEATECCISLMRKHGSKRSPKKVGIVSIEGSYHGRTLAAKFAGGSPGLADGLDRASVLQTQLPLPGGPGSQGFEHDFATTRVNPETTAGIIFESIPGWSTTLYPKEYMRDLMRWAQEHGALVAVDEVQAGMGRTGRWFAFEHYGITPDLIACGKGLSSSLPASAVMAATKLWISPNRGDVEYFWRKSVSAAAVLANLDVIRDESSSSVPLRWVNSWASPPQESREV